MVSEKQIHISAIIPDELYIQRDADRKLQEIILRMSKPAYISVSRQMGKTNLLIHAKRKLENSSHRYVFIDITNEFDNSQECFRYIIDEIINANEDVEEFQIAGKLINQKRLPTTKNPTKDFQDELRIVLRHFKGNLVVFLDEVDDLRKHSFSDEIFAQIRKNYFIRITYPEFNRLSYVLSGVIDPEKLIKNKENSPFNIAIPVYLDDFNKQEFDLLCSKAALPLDEEIIDHIFSWLNGNPRMSFDILSKVEDEYLQGNKVTPQVIDMIIEETYLQSSKHPPIDHIRDIIKHNTDARKAVLKLKEGNGKELPYDILNKLYLFGIIGSRIKTKEIVIKNKVIEKSLSKEWLNEVELQKDGYYRLGKEKMEAGLYQEAINYFVEYVQNTPKGVQVGLANYSIGQCYHLLEQYEISNQYLLKIPITIERAPSLFYDQLVYVGHNFFRLGNLSEALKFYQQVIDGSSEMVSKVLSLINKVEILINEDYDKEHLVSELKVALGLIGTNSEDFSLRSQSLAVIYYRLGALHFENKNESKEYFKKALEYASNLEKPHILSAIEETEIEIEIKRVLNKEISQLIITNKLKYTKEESTLLPFDIGHVYVCLLNLLELKEGYEYQNLLDYVILNLNESNYTLGEFLISLANFSLKIKKELLALDIYHQILNLPSCSSRTIMIALRNIGLDYSNKGNKEKSIEYFQRFMILFSKETLQPSEIQLNDLTAFTTLVVHYRNNNNLEASFLAADCIEKKYDDDLPIETKSLYIIILYFIMDYYRYKGNIEQFVKYGNNTLALITEVKSTQVDLTYMNKSFLLEMEQNTKKAMHNANILEPLSQPYYATRQKGRNEWIRVRYRDGQEKTDKYKKLKEEIDNGDCIIIDN